MMNKGIYLSTKLWFGKYKNADKSIYQLIQEDTSYVNWLLNYPFTDHYIDPRVWKMFKHYWNK